MSNQIQIFPQGTGKPSTMVVSHERSGTHFLINTLSRAFAYSPADQRLDLDYHGITMNFFAPLNWRDVFLNLSQHALASVVKSHHNADFMRPVIEDVLKGATVLYIYRHPRDVMHSLWRLLRNLQWHEGPARPSPAELMRSQPEGYMMRYQMVQYESMLHRWMDHVQGWADLADQYDDVHLVRYEDLRDDYEGTVKTIGDTIIGKAPGELSPPDRNTNVVVPNAQDSTQIEWTEADLRHIEDVTGPLLKRLGYT